MDIGVVYHIESAQQFWSELDDILSLPRDASLATLDSRLRTFVTLGATYHERYLSTDAQLDHSCQLLLDSDFFTFHSGRACEILLDDSQSSTDPHVLFILYNILLLYGLRHHSFFRSAKKWQPLLPLLVDHILVGTDDVNSDFIESKLRILAVELLYEVCRVQKMSAVELRIFDDRFINHLFELIEEARSNDTLSYSIVKLLVSMNEQFMVVSIPPKEPKDVTTESTVDKTPALRNRVLGVLMQRLHSSKTFGENLIFMLNRADATDEDLVMQLLILKMLYLLFTTSGTQQYFYTNDLRVLVDVFVRELNNISEENESLRHTYLRVLHPLLSNTQLRDNPYKPLLLRHTLETFLSHAHIRDVNPTTRRLVDRCLGGDWCKALPPATPSLTLTVESAGSSSSSDQRSPIGNDHPLSRSMHLTPTSGLSDEKKQRTLARSASAEILMPSTPLDEIQASFVSRTPSKSKGRAGIKSIGRHLQAHNGSSASLASVAAANDQRPILTPIPILPSPPPPSSRSAPPPASPAQRRVSRASARSHSLDPPILSPTESSHANSRAYPFMDAAGDDALTPNTLASAAKSPLIGSVKPPSTTPSARTKGKAPPPPPPPRRRKPPAVPSDTGRGETMQTIASSSPLNPNYTGQKPRPVHQRSA